MHKKYAWFVIKVHMSLKGQAFEISNTWFQRSFNSKSSQAMYYQEVAYTFWVFHSDTKIMYCIISEWMNCLHTSWILSKQVSSSFIIDPDEKTEWDTSEPPSGIEWSQSEAIIQPRGILQEHCQQCFKHNTEIQEPISTRKTVLTIS